MIEGRFAPDAAAGLAVSVLSFAYPKGTAARGGFGF